jgi:hypothetical protein
MDFILMKPFFSSYFQRPTLFQRFKKHDSVFAEHF